MANSFVNKKVVLTSTSATTLYTVPAYATAVIKSILVSDDSTVGNTDGTTTYYEHETGTNQIKAGATSAIAASIESGDFDLGQSPIPQQGDGEFMMKIRRVIPDFLTQTGDARVTLNLKNYPTDSQASSSLGPFTTTTSTTKIDTRARARAISLKVDNTSTTQHWKLGTFRLDIQPDGRR